MGEIRHGARGNYRICTTGPGGKACEACLVTERERQREWRANRRANNDVYTPPAGAATIALTPEKA